MKKKINKIIRKKKKSKLIRPNRKPDRAPINQIIPVLVDVYFLAKHFGKTERTIQNWVKKWRSEGMQPAEKRGTYDFVNCLAWRNKDLETELQIRSKGDETESQIRKEMMAIKRDTAMHDLAVKRAEMLKTSDAKYILANACALANKEFENIPSTHATRLSFLKTPEEIESYLKSIIDKAKLNAADLDRQADSFAKRYSDDLARAELSGS